jgi:hypothetical protein
VIPFDEHEQRILEEKAQLERQLDQAVMRAGLMDQALRAVLLFHSGAFPWTPEKANQWGSITGTDEVTTKVLCDTVRHALAKQWGSAP